MLDQDATQQQLDKWLSKIEAMHPKDMELGLDRIQPIAQQLDVVEFNGIVITIAGTNGKGSTVALLDHILRAAGYRVSCYTSPHLLRFNERIQCDGELISDQDLIAVFEQVDRARGEIQLTYFEFTTLAALVYFKQQSPNILLLEVGLGGRLDAVNIVHADATIITSIDYDHMQWLGTALDQIAAEKAGIFRSGIPAICGSRIIPQTITDKAQAVGAPLFCLDRDYYYSVNENTWQWRMQDIQLSGLPIPKLPLQNAATSLMTLHCLKQLTVTEEALIEGLQQAQLSGRWQQFSLPQLVLLDIAHNPAASRQLAEHLSQQNPQKRNLGVVGMLTDKDIRGTLQPMQALIDIWYLGSLQEPRGANASALAEELQALSKATCYTAASVVDAFKQALTDCQDGDQIVVFGSCYTVAAVQAYMNLARK